MAARSQFEPLREAAWYQYCRIALRPTARIPNLHACMRSLMCAAGQGVRLDGAHGPECGRHTHWCPLAGCPPATTVHRPCGANQIVARSRRNNPNRCTRLSVNEKGEGRFRVDMRLSPSVPVRPTRAGDELSMSVGNQSDTGRSVTGAEDAVCSRFRMHDAVEGQSAAN